MMDLDRMILAYNDQHEAKTGIGYDVLEEEGEWRLYAIELGCGSAIYSGTWQQVVERCMSLGLIADTVCDATDNRCGNIYTPKQLSNMANLFLRMRQVLKTEWYPKDVDSDQLLEAARECDRFAMQNCQSYRNENHNLADMYDDMANDLESAYRDQLGGNES